MGAVRPPRPEAGFLRFDGATARNVEPDRPGSGRFDRDVAAAVGALLGAIVAFGMVYVMARAFATEDEDAGLQVEFAFTWQSLIIAFPPGVLRTRIGGAFLAFALVNLLFLLWRRNWHALLFFGLLAALAHAVAVDALTGRAP